MGAFAGAILTIGDKGVSPESHGGAYVSREAFTIRWREANTGAWISLRR